MKTPIVLLITASLLANVALALRVAGTASSIDTGSALIQPDADDAAVGGIDTKAAVLLALEQQAFADAERAARQYWKSGGAFERDYGQAVVAAREFLRAELIRIYGPEARRDRAFRHLFRPLDPLYSFLSSDQQLAIEALRLARDAGLQQAIGRGVPSRAAGGTITALAGSAARLAGHDYERGVAALLDEDLLFEFMLRDSPIAENLRRSTVDFSESEFRETFRIMQQLEQSASGIDAALAARQALREVLGDGRFAQLWASRDPLFGRIGETASRLGISGDAMQSVYEVMSDFQDQQMQLAGYAQSDPARAAEQAAALRDRERQAVASLVGEEFADEILRARAVGTYQLFRGDLVIGQE